MKSERAVNVYCRVPVIIAQPQCGTKLGQCFQQYSLSLRTVHTVYLQVWEANIFNMSGVNKDSLRVCSLLVNIYVTFYSQSSTPLVYRLVAPIINRHMTMAMLME
jgi:hypothetical protein